VEYDGEQHFRASNKFGGLKFDTYVINDTIKNKYCADNGINLIRIPFNMNGNQIEGELLNAINGRESFKLLGNYPKKGWNSDEKTNLQETIRKVLREESTSPFIRRRWNLVRQAERESYDYMVHRFKDHVHRNSEIGESAFTNMYCTIIMDGLHPFLSDNGTKEFDYDGVFDEIKNFYKENIHELWKYLNEKYNS